MGNLVSLALVAKAGKFDSRTLYAGWDEAGLPTITADESDLSAEATEQASVFLHSGYPIPILSMRKQLGVVVVEFAGPVQDLKDPSPRNLVQDTIKVSVRDSRGNAIELVLGELEVLEMIGNNLLVFQRFGSVLDTAERQEAVSMYSFFLSSNSEYGAGRQDLLVLLRPTNENLGNLIDAIIFMQDIVKKLLQNDERQPREYKKGYLVAGHEAEDEINKQLAKSKGLFSFLYVPESPVEQTDSLKQMIKDLLMVPTDGSKPSNFFMVPERKILETAPDRRTLDRMRLTAAKMFLFAKSRIRSNR